MKTAIAIVTAFYLMGALGCTSSRGGGMTSGEGFTITTPAFDTKVVQGTSQNVIIVLNRGDSFKRDVTLEIKVAKGISVAPTSTVVKASAAPDVQLRITAPKDAALGDYKVYLRGTPTTGEATSTEFTVKVVAP